MAVNMAFGVTTISLVTLQQIGYTASLPLVHSMAKNISLVNYLKSIEDQHFLSILQHQLQNLIEVEDLHQT